MAKLLDDTLANTVQDTHRERQHTRIDRTRRRVGPVNTFAGIRRLIVTDIQDDYLTCRTWDGVTKGDTDVYVAKPYFLQKTPHDGETRRGITASSYSAASATRIMTRDADAETENQIVIPSYAANDEIFAMSAATGVTTTTEDDELDVVLIDLNNDARTWAHNL